MHQPEAETIVREYWRLMATNDFGSVLAVLAPDFLLEWPQSNERIRGGENFARMNTVYVARGPWHFDVHRIVANENEAVSDVGVTDGVTFGRAVTFFTIEHGKIAKIVEFWPEPFHPKADRAHLVELVN